MKTEESSATPAAQNPASPPDLIALFDSGARERVPMSVPRQRLQVPEIPGYVLYWMLEENVSSAFQAGYELVKTDDVRLNQFNVATTLGVSGNADLGTNVTMMGNKPSQENGGKAQMLYLMKIREDWYKQDQRKIAEANARRMEPIFRGEQIIDVDGEGGSGKGDRSLRYVDKDRTGIARPLFNRPARKAST